MKSLIRHFLTHNREEVLKTSHKNFLVKGLHRIPLLKDKIYLFITDKDHEMWRNSSEFYQEGMSLGFTYPSTSKTIHVVSGQLGLWKAEPVYSGDLVLNRYVLNSVDLSIKLERPNTNLKTVRNFPYSEDRAFSISHKDLYTISCNKGKVVAWIEMQGEQAPMDSLHCWSNQQPQVILKDLNQSFQNQQEIWKLVTAIKDL